MEYDQSPLGGPLELPGEQPPTSFQPEQRRRKFGVKKLFTVLIIIFVIGLLGFGAFKLLQKPKKASPQPSASSSKTTTASRELTVSDIPDVTSTKTLKNATLLVELTYPTGWTPTEKSDGIKLESPDFNYLKSDGLITTGNFRVYIRKGAREVDSKYIGRGVATSDSQPLTYTAPATGQRKTTNLSLFGLDTPDQFAYLLIAGNFTLKKGDTLGPGYGKESDTVLVTGGYSAKTLTDDFATNQVPLDGFDKTNAYKQALDIVKSLKLE